MSDDDETGPAIPSRKITDRESEVSCTVFNFGRMSFKLVVCFYS